MDRRDYIFFVAGFICLGTDILVFLKMFSMDRDSFQSWFGWTMLIIFHILAYYALLYAANTTDESIGIVKGDGEVKK